MLEKIAYFYLIIPLIIFGFAWFNLPAAVVFLLSLSISCYFMNFETSGTSANSYRLDKKTIVVAILIATFWCFWSGIGGHIYQSSDFHARNAIYRDLIQKSWPVYYERGETALNYYFGYWLFPAFLTKILKELSVYPLFSPGLSFLLLYTIIGVSIFLLLLVSYMKPKNNKQLFLILLFPIFFSGLDIIGAIIYQIPLITNLATYNLNSPIYHNMIIEIWLGIGALEYNNMTTQLFWVFNQAVPCWIITMLLLKEKDNPKNYGILLTTAVFLCPLPAAGIMIFMAFFCVAFMCHKDIAFKDKIKSIFSLSNIYIIPVFVIVLWFLGLHQDNNPLGFASVPIMTYLLFCILEFGCYVFFIFHMYRKNMLFYAMIISLCSLLLFSFAESNSDFQMRSTFPALLILCIFVLKYLLSEKALTFNKKIVVLLLIIGLCTPMVEFSRGIMHILETKNIYHRADYWRTLNYTENEWPYTNYKVIKPYDISFYTIMIKPSHTCFIRGKKLISR